VNDHVDQPGSVSDDTGDAARPVVDRAAAFAQTTPAVPRKFVYWVLAAAAVLGLGGLLFEHIFSSAGLNPVPAAVKKVPVTTTTKALSAAPLPGGQSRELGASLDSFMGLTKVAGAPAPGFSLIDQSGQPTSLADESGKVVVLTFFNGPCNDICPVLAAEIRLADAALGSAAAKVEFVTVNTDPTALAASGMSAALAQPGMGALSNWHMLTGPLATLNAVWKAYGITISVSPHTGVEAHNEVIYFISAQGQERYRATPFADESRSGTWSLATASIARWGTGIATYAGRLANP
jgi:cytochrome oxidase Cu insertion factor (SCO1/SenC/PrrC family)